MQDLEALVSKQADQLQQNGKLKGAALAQMFQSVCKSLNGDSGDGQVQTARKKV